jgi:hypothetical protein
MDSSLRNLLIPVAIVAFLVITLAVSIPLSEGQLEPVVLVPAVVAIALIVAVVVIVSRRGRPAA